MFSTLLNIIKTDRGDSAAEYGFVAGLVAIMIITGTVFVGGKMGVFFNYIGSELSNALPVFSVLR